MERGGGRVDEYLARSLPKNEAATTEKGFYGDATDRVANKCGDGGARAGLGQGRIYQDASRQAMGPYCVRVNTGRRQSATPGKRLQAVSPGKSLRGGGNGKSSFIVWKNPSLLKAENSSPRSKAMDHVEIDSLGGRSP